MSGDNLPAKLANLRAIELADLDPDDRRWFARAKAVAIVAATSGLVPKAIEDHPEAALAIFITARELGIEPSLTALHGFHIIEGKVTPSAQLMVGLAGAKGHEVWWEACDDQSATVAIRRRGSDRVQRFTFTLEQARQAGLLDRYVEKWVDDGNRRRKMTYALVEGEDPPDWAKEDIKKGWIKQRDNWQHYPADMLRARAAARAIRHACPEVVLGLPTLLDDLEPVAEEQEVDGAPSPQTPQAAPQGAPSTPLEVEPEPDEPPDEGPAEDDREPKEDRFERAPWPARFRDACSSQGWSPAQAFAICALVAGPDAEPVCLSADERQAVNTVYQDLVAGARHWRKLDEHRWAIETPQRAAS